MSYQPSVAIFEIDAPLNSRPLLTSQPRSLRKMATGTSLIYGPSLLLLLAACANGNDGPIVEARTEDIDQTPEEAGYRNTLTGTDGDDKGDDELEGDDKGNIILGLRGDDHIYGKGGIDLLLGGAGTDHIEGGAGNDTIYGDDGDDTIYAGAGSDDYVRGGAGNDVIYAGPGENDIDGEEGDDTIYASLGLNTIDGGDGYDTVDYSDAARSVYLFLGIVDEYLGSTYGNMLVDAQDERFYEGGEFGPRDNVVRIESVILSDHDDQVATDGFAKEFDGGDGTDTLVFANSIEPVTIDLRGGADADGYYVMAPSSETEPQYDSYEKGTKFKNFERIAGTEEDDTFYGADDADFFFLSGDGDDKLVSGKGSDTFHAGHWDHGGYDAVEYSRAEGGINVDLNDLDDDNFSAVTIDHADWKDDKIKYVEDVIGSDYDDTFSGEVDTTNYFTGGAGSDLFYIDEWEHERGVDFEFDVVTDFVVGTDKIGFWVSEAILNTYFVEGSESIDGFFGAFGVSQEIDGNVLSFKHLDVTILEIDDYSDTEVLSLDVTNFTLSLDVA